MLTVRDTDARAERSVLVEILKRELPDWDDEAKFDWLYLDNPCGRARVWTLQDGSGGVVGVSAAFPRRIQLGARVISAWVLGDFCVASTHRSLGPAVMLQRAVHAAVDRGELEVWYDFPSHVMMAVHRRIGVDRVGELIRFVRPLRIDGVIEEKLGEHAVSRGLSAAGNALLSVGAAVAKRDRALSIRPREHDFAEPDGLKESEDGVSLQKSFDYLNWRYRQDPRGGLQILEAARNGIVEGWLVYRVGEKRVSVVDAFGIRSEGVLRELVLAVVDAAIERGLNGITVGLTDEHMWRPVFESLGFRARESVPYVAYGNRDVTSQSTRWSLIGGDRDL